MTRGLLPLIFALGLAAAALAAESPQEQRAQEALQRYNAGVAALAKRDLESALHQFRLFHQSAPQDPKAPAAVHNIEVLEPQVK